MKCPVCGNELNDDCVRCTECTFDQLHKTFLNKEEYEMWMRETVLPCRRVFYKCSKEFLQVGEQYKKYHDEADKYKKLLYRILKENETIKEKLKDLQFRNKSYFYSASALCENMTNPIDSGVSKGLLDDWDQEVVEMINDIISRLE